MTLSLAKNGIEIVCGSKNIEIINDVIFSALVCDFLNDLSNLILSDKKLKYPDIVAFGFWLRKKNIKKYIQQYSDNFKRVGVGLAYHITPSNIPTNFAYSFIFGVVAGNSNVIKISDLESFQSKYIIKKIRKLFKEKKYENFKKTNAFIKYKHDDEINSYLSSKCNARILWGGNNTINLFKKFKTAERTREINFPDRYSICLINASYLKSLEKNSYNKLIQNFFNDTFLVDQNACSSPRLVIWLKKKSLDLTKIKKSFWKRLGDKLVNYHLDASLDYKKFTILCETLTKGNYKLINNSINNKLYLLQKKSLEDLSVLSNLKLGIFFEYETSNIDEVFNLKDQSIQTLSYIGFEKKYLRNIFEKNACSSYDRIVPVGTVLDMDFSWDGYTIPYELSRIVDIK